jgi:glycine reductase complex component B subunit gamma
VPGDAVIRVVHYLNQFFAGVGGEESAATPPASSDAPVGPGRRLQTLLGPDYQIVATVWCGDDHAASSAAVDEILTLVRAARPDLVLAGPAFSSGRYGMACARVAAAAANADIPALAAMYEDNPGLDEAKGVPVVASGSAARHMGPSLDRLAAAARKLAQGQALTSEDGRISRPARRGVLADRTGAERAVDLVLARLAGDRDATEVPLPRFEPVNPAPPVDSTVAAVALLTEGGLVPDGNPDRLESARATRWLRYRLPSEGRLPTGAYCCIHGGFSTVWANEDPHRILPLDVATDLEQEGAVGRLFPEYLVTTGNGTSVGNARRFGVEWAAQLRRAGIQAAILTST